MSAHALLERLKTAGLSVGVANGQLDISGPRPALASLPMAELRQHKAELLHLLARSAMDDGAAQERAAILEYDGGLPRAMAEKAAAWELAQRPARQHRAALQRPVELPTADMRGFSAFEAEVARIEGWLAALDRLPEARTPEVERLAQLTFEFALGNMAHWGRAAIVSGWSDAELFAMDSGLIPEMNQRGMRLDEVTERFAWLARGEREFERVDRPQNTEQPPWWRDVRVTRG